MKTAERKGPPKPATEVWRPSCNPWVTSVTLHPDGRIELRFDDGRRVDDVEIVNDKLETITSAQVNVMPGEGLVLRTSPGAAPRPVGPMPPRTLTDGAGIYTEVWRLSAQGNTFAFRAPGSIGDGEVLHRAGGGRYRIRIVHNDQDALGEYPNLISEREVNFDASYNPFFPFFNPFPLR